MGHESTSTCSRAVLWWMCRSSSHTVLRITLHVQVAERRQLLDDMSAGLGVMAAGFGQEHQLVRKATVIWEAARRSAETIK